MSERMRRLLEGLRAMQLVIYEAAGEERPLDHKRVHGAFGAVLADQPFPVVDRHGLPDLAGEEE